MDPPASKVRRVLLGEGGLGPLVGTSLLLGLGLSFVLHDPEGLRTALRTEPAVKSCDAWARAPERDRWVTVTGCRLESAAAPPASAGLDAGAGMAVVPLEGADGARVGFLATADGALIAHRSPRAEAREGPDAGVEPDGGGAPAAGARSDDGAEPDAGPGPTRPPGAGHGRARAPAGGALTLTGASEVHRIAGADAPVLVQGKDPRSARALLTPTLGLLLMAWALWPVARRWQLVREADATAEAMRRRYGGE